MVTFPNCKINIGLHVVNKRVDGFHNIESVFYPIQLKDALEIIEDSSAKDEIIYTQSGLKIPGNTADDLCLKAYHLLKKDYPDLPNVKIHLHKVIPIGAGLGGGSSDAASMLKLVAQKFDLEIPETQLLAYASLLGSDCPFFMINRPCFASGRGEILEEIQIDITDYKILLVNPGIHINTGWAFSNLKIEKKELSFKELIKLPIKNWQHHIFNDFEKPIFEAHPEIAILNEELKHNGAIYTSMSGSGSSIFGIFNKELYPTFNFPAHYFSKWV